MKRWIISAAVLLLAAACQQSPTRSLGSHDQIVADFVRVTTPICASEMAADEGAQKVLRTLNKTARQVCRCSYEKFFGAMSDADLNRFIADVQKHREKIAEMQPWNRQYAAATLSCMAPSELEAKSSTQPAT